MSGLSDHQRVVAAIRSHPHQVTQSLRDLWVYMGMFEGWTPEDLVSIAQQVQDLAVALDLPAPGDDESRTFWLGIYEEVSDGKAP